ncbi:hypothetical protein K0M31_016909, partial [Melipona bicolor]
SFTASDEPRIVVFLLVTQYPPHLKLTRFSLKHAWRMILFLSWVNEGERDLINGFNLKCYEAPYNDTESKFEF